MYVLLPSKIILACSNEKDNQREEREYFWRYSSEEALTFVNILSFKIYRNTDIMRAQEKSRPSAMMWTLALEFCPQIIALQCHSDVTVLAISPPSWCHIFPSVNVSQEDEN